MDELGPMPVSLIPLPIVPFNFQPSPPGDYLAFPPSAAPPVVPGVPAPADAEEAGEAAAAAPGGKKKKNRRRKEGGKRRKKGAKADKDGVP